MKRALERLGSLLRFRDRRDRRSLPHQSLDLLQLSYRQLSGFARQVEAHSKLAPYSHLAKHLLRIAAEKKDGVEMLAAKITADGGHPTQELFDLQSGKNHWERVTRDLESQRLLERQFLERAALLSENAPQSAALLQQIIAAELPHKEAFLDMVAKADPQADQT